MKVKESTDLAKYGFKVDKFGYWILSIPGFTGKGKDKNTPIRLEIVVATDRDIFIFASNDHLEQPNYWADEITQSQIEDDYYDLYNFEETTDIPKALFDLIRNNEIEYTETPA